MHPTDSGEESDSTVEAMTTPPPLPGSAGRASAKLTSDHISSDSIRRDHTIGLMRSFRGEDGLVCPLLPLKRMGRVVSLDG